MYLSTKPDGCRRDSGVSDVESNMSKSDTSTDGRHSGKSQGSLEYAKLWEELRYTGQGLDNLFEESKESAYEIKSAYDSIHQLITINEGLKLKYYEALATKKKFDEERDEYFKTDAELASKKEEFIEDSQKHAYQHSRYVEYSKRFSKRREEYIERLLRDVEKYLEQVESLSREKQKLRKEVSDQRQEIYSLRNDLKTRTIQHETAVQSCDKLKKDLEKHKKELQWMNRQMEKLKSQNQRIDEENKNLQNKEEELQDELRKYASTIDELSEKRRELVDKCSQLNQALKAKEEDLEQEERDRESDRKIHLEERESLENTIQDLEAQKQKIRDNNQKTLRQLSQLRKRFDTTTKKNALVEKEKNAMVTKEHKTSEKNVELAVKQLELIDEVLALKKTFFEDQERIKKGGKQYRRLEGKLNALRQQMELLKENPSVIDPLEFSQEYREHVVKKMVTGPIKEPPGFGATYLDNTWGKHVPVIGQIPEPNRRPTSESMRTGLIPEQRSSLQRKSAPLQR